MNKTKKIDWDSLRWETPACPVCQSARQESYCAGSSFRHAGGPVFSSAICRDCGQIFQSPRIIHEDFVKQVIGNDPLYHTPSASASRTLWSIAKRRDAKWIASSLFEGARVLEIGAGEGDLLRRLEAFGLKAEGLEPDPHTAAAAQKNDLIVHHGTVELFAPSSLYDAVILRYVLTNLYEPVCSLKRIASWLKPEGQIILWLQDFSEMKNRFWGRWVVRRGLPLWVQGFTRSTLTRALAESGFAVETIQIKPLPAPNDFANAVDWFVREHFGLIGRTSAGLIKTGINLTGIIPAFVMAVFGFSTRIRVTAVKK